MTDSLPRPSGGLPTAYQADDVTTHSRSLARMRATLAAPAQPVGVRALSRRPADEPVIALLDSWAVVADIVAFYTRQVAREGFLSTATELETVRELARSVGHELQPGVAAQADLAFSVEEAPGAPEEVVVPQGTAVQSVPGPGQAPQIFETDTELCAHAAWNAVPAISAVRQTLRSGTARIWIEGTASEVRAGDTLLVVTGASADQPSAAWSFMTVTDVAVRPPGRPGWTLLSVAPAPGTDGPRDTVPLSKGAQVHRFTQRADLSGWNSTEGPPVAPRTRASAPQRSRGVSVLELDGDHLRVLPGSWLVVESPPAETEGQASAALGGGGERWLYRVTAAFPSARTQNGFGTRITMVHTDCAPREFDPRSAVVHCQSEELPARRMPRTDPIVGRRLNLTVTEPLLPPGRAVLVQGKDVRTGAPAAERAEVVACAVDPARAVMTVTLDRELEGVYAPETVVVRGNVVTATHGETVNQVLGSGDGEQRFTALGIWRGPLTYVRTSARGGARSTLGIRVNGELWKEVSSLREAGPDERVYVVRNAEDGTATAVFGDGVRGARLPTGTENVTASYRVGIGADGGVAPGQLSLLLHRPLGIASMTNPTAAHGWAPPETLEDARGAAPRRTRTLDRVVSVGDYEDFALAFAGVGTARADLIWDGNRKTIVLSVLGAGAERVDQGLLTDLAGAIQDVCTPGACVRVLEAAILWFGVRLGMLVDPAHERHVVERAVGAALQRAFAPDRQQFRTPVTAAAVTAVVQGVPGVAACDLPRLLQLPVPGTELPPAQDSATEEVLVASPARQTDKGTAPARLVGLAPGAVKIGVMPA
ncbi:putative baseplate assembly protein [Streptomyces sp. NPDC005476]|uniref:putative baseplate assembly protein n=1 Tax=Streptomyces sp. NPDC005476 TaxID=3156882 RepID=UPI003451D965